MKLKLSVLFLGVLLFVTACDEEDARKTYDGPAVIEWFNQYVNPANRPTGVVSGTGPVFTPADNDLTTRRVNDNLSTVLNPDVINIQLISAPSGSATQITVAVNSASTARAGVDYNLPSLTVTLPAGSNIVQFPVQVLDAPGADGVTRDLILEITSVSNGVSVNPNYRTFTYRIRNI